MRLAAGALFLLLPTLAVLVGSLIGLSLIHLPAGLHGYPIALTLRFFLASAVAYAVFFAISSATQRTAGFVLGSFAAILLAAFVLGALDATADHSEMIRISIALGLLGLGWSASIIGGSTLLTQSVAAEARVPLQGSVDAMMNLGAAALAAVAGPVLALGGFLAVNVMAACVLAPFLVLGLRSLVQARRSGAPDGGDLTAAVRSTP